MTHFTLILIIKKHVNKLKSTFVLINYISNWTSFEFVIPGIFLTIFNLNRRNFCMYVQTISVVSIYEW